MSRKKWKREPLTGVSIKQLEVTDWLSFSYEFKAKAFPDCNVYDVSTIANLAGFSRPDHFKSRALTDNSSYFHLHPVVSDEEKLLAYCYNRKEKILTYCTHVDSAKAGGEAYRKAANARMKAGKKITDVSGGSGNG